MHKSPVPARQVSRTNNGEELMEPPRSETFALVVGIENYQDKEITRVDYAENDANDLYQILVEAPFDKYPQENVQRLLSHEGTKE